MSVRIERSGPVTTIVLSRPEARNAVDGPTAQELIQAFEEFDADESASVAVLWGEGGTFCSGADLKALGTPRSNHATEHGDGPMGPTRMRLSKPVIAAVSGYAVAGGLELALWCDLRIAEDDATFGVFCRRWGVPLIDGGTVRLPRIVGTGRAMDMILTGRAVDSEEALNIGLITRRVPVGRARSEAEALAAQLALLPQTCMREDRLSLLEQDGLDEETALRNEFRHGAISINADALSGASRFASGAGRHGTASP
ncbi:enoyl-CoA hydratase [Rhodococcus sp. 15-725-2-2b]|jgi:enoyl-CoA hydratase|uniref:crotonase/enoyl-CoA hydratase family protein n=1 Tax=Nocardiaceae TaxID=85025 RepID=UPI00050CB3DA|nr:MULTISPECIES: crotonase/enoyl-CoA hydratase family protein [Rhodococcus]AJW40459.1 Enoyl-CoA hydratase [Rhodococcus sp. B7740]OZC67044.1 enoyl-CoA hydratase [Rhodococcus sp. 06-470-2]OZC72672.1 enoyl-CoA hydratase [Rhodococcus sp. 06-469-3-2]OZC76834.1 enoyl-CoA hydratase [Rhodococcus sp. 06-418-5]OZD48899.1 enoyl-CoA hydratase [Rhodococcus sp. 06-1477-1A]